MKQTSGPGGGVSADGTLPDGFVYLEDIVPGILVDLKYAGSDNFLGRPVEGYLGARAILTRAAAEAVGVIQSELHERGLGIRVFDAYRPQRAVDQFVRWTEDLSDTATRAAYYPDVAKDELIPGGYIARQSSHSRGSTLDMTLVSLRSGVVVDLDMGTDFDFFGPESWPGSDSISDAQQDNREFLHELMQRHGFSPLKQEWWHFTLCDEPFPDTYFDFPVE